MYNINSGRLSYLTDRPQINITFLPLSLHGGMSDVKYPAIHLLTCVGEMKYVCILYIISP